MSLPVIIGRITAVAGVAERLEFALLGSRYGPRGFVYCARNVPVSFIRGRERTMPRPMFQKRHYVLLASLLQNIRQRTLFDAAMVDSLASELAAEFYRDNERFDPVRFLSAVQDNGR